MDNYQDRVLAEFNELGQKWFKLTQFLTDATADAMEKIGLEEINRLKKQADVMEEYMDILAERIESFSK